MVAYISCAGRFPKDINETYQKHCRRILEGLNISEEQFIKDVDKSIEYFDKDFNKTSYNDCNTEKQLNSVVNSELLEERK